jgi:hypothetical protein
MNESPIACSLSAEDIRRRLSTMRKLGEVALLEVEARPDGALLSFRNSPHVRNELSSIVEAEAECCSFLKLSVDADGERLVLAVLAPPDAMPVVRYLTASFQGTEVGR